MPTSIRIKMHADARDLFPRKAHADDAAYDLCSRVETVLEPGIQQCVPTGVYIELPIDMEAQIRPRSGLAAKHGLTLLNAPGTIDAGYRGEIAAILINHSREPYAVKRGERIAQMVIARLEPVQFIQADELSDTLRGSGGFGSSGKL